MRIFVMVGIVIGILLVVGGTQEYTRPALQQIPTPAPETIVNSQLVVRALEPTWVTPSNSGLITTFATQTAQGKLSITFTDMEVKVHDGDTDSFSLPLPSEYKLEDGLGRESAYSGDHPGSTTRIFAFCKASGLYIVDVTARELKRLNTRDCTISRGFTPPFYELSWSPEGRFLSYYSNVTNQRILHFYDAVKKTLVSLDQIARLTSSWLPDWSPDWKDHVYLTDVYDLSVYTKCPDQPQSLPDNAHNAIMWNHRLTKAITVVACISWPEIDFLQWITQDQLLFAGQDYRDGGTKEEELFVFDRRIGKTINLGSSIKAFSGLFFDGGKKFAHIKVRVEPVNADPSECTLSILDLTTFKDTEVEPTYCIQPADMTILENQRQLIYLNSAIPADISAAPNIPMVHIVNLDTLAVQPLKEVGITYIGSPSPDNHYLMMVHADAPRDIFFAQPYDASNLVIYDAQQRKTVYTDDWGSRFFYEGFFSWSPDSSAFTFTVSADYMAVMGSPQYSTRLNEKAQNCNSDPCSNRFPAWSPDGHYLLFFAEDGIKVIRRTDHVIIPITRLVDAKDYYVQAEWRTDGLLTVETVPRTGYEPLTTLNRWLVDPHLADLRTVP